MIADMPNLHEHEPTTWAKRWWGPRWRLRIGRLLGFVVCSTVVFSHPFAVEGSWLDVTLESVGWLLWMIGGTLRFWATLYIGGRKNRVLIDEGPYSLCRNPLYLGSFCLAASAALFFQSISFAVGVGLLMVLYARGSVPAEEALLRKRAGAVYDDYCRRVPRFFPRLRGYRGAPTLEISLKPLWREYRRAMIWLWLPLLADIVELLRDQPWWPHFLNLP